MRYLIYVRVSGDDQDVKTQIENGNRYVDEIFKPGDTRQIVEEGALSSRVKMEKRPLLQSLLESACKGDCIVLAAFDRLARCPNELVQICWKLFDKGAQIYSIAQPNIHKDLIPIFGSVASMERTAISRRTKEKLTAKAARGELCGTPPYGMQIDEKRLHLKTGLPYLLIPHPREAQVVAHIVQARSEGRSYRAIACELSHLGHVNRAGQPFQSMTVQRIALRQSDSIAAAALQQVAG